MMDSALLSGESLLLPGGTSVQCKVPMLNLTSLIASSTRACARELEPLAKIRDFWVVFSTQITMSSSFFRLSQ